jgi:O-6-methylguanine DNA methyltransferase
MTLAGPTTPEAFRKRVLQVVSRIPAGKVASYGDVAALAGRPRAARAVGRIMAAGDRPGLPYHRVVSASGQVGGYGGSPALKASLLVAEGLAVRQGRILGFAASRWRP